MKGDRRIKSPAAQVMQLEPAVAGWTVPATQSVQMDAPAVAVMAPMRQDLQTVEPEASVYCPAGQSVQTEVVVWYLPAAHEAHSCLPVEPCSGCIRRWYELKHNKTGCNMNCRRTWAWPLVQLVQSVAPWTEYLPAAQLMHTSEVIALAVSDCFPAAHLTQKVAPNVA